MALREKMAPSETVIAVNAERGRKKTQGCGKKNEREMKRKKEERENIAV
jgi:hypothetical protein